MQITHLYSSLKSGIIAGLIATCGGAHAATPLSLTNSYTPAVAGGADVFVSADILYWKPWERSLVLTNEKSTVFFTDDFTKAKVIHPHFEWDVGYRVGVGYLFSDHLWDVTLDWAHYHSRVEQHRSTNSNDLTASEPKGMFPIWALSEDIISGDYVTKANLHWKLTIDLIDLEFGRHFFFGNWFEIRPYAGLRSGWIKQHMNIAYAGGIFFITILQGGVPLTGTDAIKMKNDFWGMGPIVGIDPRIILGKGCSLYADAAISNLIGYFSVKQKEVFLNRTRFEHHQHPVRFSWVGDLAAGVEEKILFSHDRYALTFKLGWEYHIFFHQMVLKKDEFHLVSHNRNLDVQGVTFAGRFDF